MKTEQTTTFQTAVDSWKAGKLQIPNVSHGDRTINFFLYQLAIHKANLSLMAKGLKIPNIKLGDIKQYYGLKGRTAADCLKDYVTKYQNLINYVLKSEKP